MTDAEIIKALECCTNQSSCDGCPYENADEKCYKDMKLHRDALDLINRQKAEIENQSENFKVLVSDHRTLQQSFDNLKGLYEAEKAKVEKAKEKCIKLAKELQTAKAEIEKLQTDNSSMQSTLAKMSMGVEQAKAKAIKEFAERLKAECKKDRYAIQTSTNFGVIDKQYLRVVDENDIDNLVKEMVGEG